MKKILAIILVSSVISCESETKNVCHVDYICEKEEDCKGLKTEKTIEWCNKLLKK